VIEPLSFCWELRFLIHRNPGVLMSLSLRIVLLLAVMIAPAAAADDVVPNVVLGVHGGTSMPKSMMTPELDKLLRQGMEAALRAGYARLQQPGATSLDGVEAAIRSLEDNPHFNAGRGAVFTLEGRNELDSSIMEGKSKRAGAVAGVTNIKNPISAARAVMEKSKHVMLIGPGAERFAERNGVEIVSPVYFWHEPRWKQLQRKLIDPNAPDDARREKAMDDYTQYGTVGAVAIDSAGNLAAGTSTGGMSNKLPGRVGDSPIIGASTYAENDTCAISSTGHGEYFIRYVVAHEVRSLVKYKGLSIQAAADEVIQKQLKPIEGEGAVIVLDPKGNLANSFNSEGLYRGWITRDGKSKVMLFEN